MHLPVTIACAVLLAGRALAADVNGAIASLAGYRVGDTVAVTRSVQGLLRDPATRGAAVRGLAVLLASTATGDAKRFALGSLAVAGTPAEVPAIAALLADADLVDPARRALERIPGPEATAALVAAANGTTGTVLAGIANSLGERRDPGAVPVLVRLAGGSDPAVASCAAGALGRICDAASVQALETLRRKALPAVRTAATDACLECAGALRGRDLGRAVEIYAALWSRTAPGRVRAAALLGLARTGGAKAFPTVLKALGDSDAAVFGAALRAVRETPGPVAPETLKATFRKLSSGDQALFVDALSWRTDAAGRGIAVAAAGGRDERLRLAGLRALGRIGDASSVALLAKASATLTGDARDAARASLDALPGAGVDAALIAMVSPKTPAPVRAEVVRSLGARGGAAAVPVIEAATRDPSAAVQLEAARAVGVLATETGLKPLVALILVAPDEGVREAAAKSAAAIVKAASDPAAAAGSVLAVLGGTGSAARAALLSILSAAGGSAAREAAEREAGNADVEVSKAAIRALGEWPTSDPHAYGFLAATATSDGDVARRVLALRGAVRLAGLPAERPAKETAGMFKFLLTTLPRPEDAKIVLAGLAKVADPAALDLAASRIAEPESRDEAVTAVVAIAGALKTSNPEEAAAALRRSLEAGAKGKTETKAKELLAELEKGADFVTAWEVVGPYRVEGLADEVLFDRAFPPEDPKAAGIDWKAPGRDPKSEMPWQVDLGYALGGEHCVAYLRTFIWSPAKTKVRLEIGSDDGVKIWLNGKVVHANNAKRPVEDGEDQAVVKLAKGWNRGLVKVTQGEGGWGFSLRVRTLDGKKVDGLKARTAPE